jgi:hypothetical protein
MDEESAIAGAFTLRGYDVVFARERVSLGERISGQSVPNVGSLAPIFMRLDHSVGFG